MLNIYFTFLRYIQFLGNILAISFHLSILTVFYNIFRFLNINLDLPVVSVRPYPVIIRFIIFLKHSYEKRYWFGF